MVGVCVCWCVCTCEDQKITLGGWFFPTKGSGIKLRMSGLSAFTL